ncbi:MULTISPECIES: hypothetical protein [unclassified Streptomyces]|uniref:hypothetical protein n=1 Tax=unclassified Streptomyces TaxID=2593676 RepID=UPI0006AF9A59|nr:MULTISPECIES: hypothetical protein [unclassified Streptomyces]KOX19222.1 hypothetical protein ADL06_29840 [Streptomyces sp. NRRL F-6491]KOX37078.1 hypothetical protein ADL08_30500 [Streptomyces sp. NRRL F-6492]
MPNAPRPDDPDAMFATAFKEALQRRGLPLDRIRDHLQSHGITLSLATLSYWQSGRSQPERPQSLRAVDILEPFLGLPGGALRSLVRRRPRGWVPQHDPAALRGFYGENSHVEQVLGDAFPHFNADLRRLVVHEAVSVNEHRLVDEIRVTTAVRAVRDSARHLTVIHTLDTAKAGKVDFAVPHGPPPSTRFLPELNCVVAEVPLGRRLAQNETAVVEYTLRSASAPGVSHRHERRLTTPLQAYLLHVRFHPLAVPSKCWHYYRRRIGTAPQTRRPAPLDGSHTAHLLPTRCAPGVYGMEWQWVE